MKKNEQHNNPLVSVITVNYNTPKEVCALIESVTNSDYSNVEIIVVDNNSQLKSPDYITQKHPSAKLIKSNKNLGFAGGNNLGVKAAKGEFFLFLNSDAVLTDGCLKVLVETFNQLPMVGIVSPKFHFLDYPGKLDYAGCKAVNRYTGRGVIIGHGELDNGQYDLLSDTGYCHGGGVLVKRSAWEKSGSMPENYFLYYEELEWSENIKKAGYRVIYQPQALIYHKVSGSIGSFSTLKTYYLTRNRILFMRRNRRQFDFIIFSLYFGLISIPKNLFVYLIKGKMAHLKYFLLAVIWNMGIKIQPKF
jgi:hypothetical protein